MINPLENSYQFLTLKLQNLSTNAINLIISSCLFRHDVFPHQDHRPYINTKLIKVTYHPSNNLVLISITLKT